ncbi:MAG TPA: hypothetical protein DD789_04820 [Firmicutes bacterium]|jgi:glycosyltransferase involved in cell wall biosynthesis|nr:hypothetical protein [Bacillota bacterium]
MKIFYAITFLHFGAGRALLDLAREAIMRGHKAVIAATEKYDQYESQIPLIQEAEDRGIPVVLVEDLFTRDFNRVCLSTERMTKLFQREKFDLIHSHAAIPGYAAMLSSKTAYGHFLPHLSTVHAWSPQKSSWMKLQDVMFLNNMNAVHAVSYDVADFLIKEGVKKELIYPIYNGCDFSRIDGITGDEETGNVIDDKKLCIGTVADLSERKGIKYLIEAVATLPVRLLNNLQVILVGEGPERESLRQRTKELGLEDVIKFVGYSTNPFKYMMKFDLFVLPSLSEGLPVTLVEAMYLKIPVLTTDAQGNREIVRNGLNGIMVPPRDSRKLAEAIELFYKNKGLYITKTEQAYRWVVENFNRSKNFDRIFQLYDELKLKVSDKD